MKITSVKTAATTGHCMHLWVKIETDAGVTGLGECVHGGHQAIALIQHELGPKLIGRDPFAIDALFEELRRGPRLRGRLRRRADHRADRHRDRPLGPEGQGSEDAGLRAARRQVPRQGPRLRRLRSDAGDELRRVQEGRRRGAGGGFTALKIDLDIGAYGKYQSEVANFVKDPFNHTAGEWEHERMVRLAEMVKTAAGKTVDVACDVHTRLDVTSAIRLARDLEQFHLMWLEEPVPPENVDAMREVKRSTTTPICAGENLYLRQGFRDLIESQAVDIIMPDIPKCGGLSECRKIANMAEIYYMPFAPHNVASPIGTMASAHVCATVPNFLVLEFHWLHRDYWATITDGGEIIKDGHISLTDRPGIGLELNEEVAKAHQYPGTTWFE